jgi:hypothetical protein
MELKMKIRIIFFVLFYFSMLQNSVAQQCGYQNYSAVLLNITDATTHQKIDGLQVHLQYENGNAIREYTTIEDVKHLSKTCIDSFTFWDNSLPFKKPKRDCDNQRFYRRNFPNAGDHYICVVPSYTGKNDLSEFSHQRGTIHEYGVSNTDALKEKPYFLQVKIVDVDGAKNGGQYATQIITIPSGAVVDICKHRLDDDAFTNSEIINPINILLEANNNRYQASITHNTFGIYPVLQYDFFNNPNDPIESIQRKKFYALNVYNEANRKILQTITASDLATKNFSIAEGKADIFTWEDEKYLRIPIDYKNAPSTLISPEEQECFKYYRFNTSSNQYELDALLNEYPYTEFSDDNRHLYATQIVINKDGETWKRHEWKNNKWNYLSEETHEYDKPDKELRDIKYANVVIEKKEISLPVQYFAEGQKIKTVTDTFWIINAGNVATTITNNSYYEKYFSVPKTIAPNQRLPIVYYRNFAPAVVNIYANYVSPFEFNTDGFTLEFDNKKTISGNMRYCIVNGNSKQFTQQDGSKIFYAPYKQYENYYLSTYPDGSLKEMGMLAKADSAKVGQWLHYPEASNNFTTDTFTKILNIELVNANIADCNFTMYLDNPNFNNDIVKNINPINGRIYFNDNIKSIRIANDSMSILLDVNYKTSVLEYRESLYLLKPNQTYFYNGKYKIPIDYSAKQFHISFNTAYDFKNRQPWTAPNHEWRNVYFKNIKEKFPNFNFINTDTTKIYNNTIIADFTACTAKEKQQIFTILQSDSNIASLNVLLNTGNMMYCKNRIYTMSNEQKVDANFIEQAKSFGFNYTESHNTGSNFQHYFVYKSKIVDATFFDNFNKLCEASYHARINLETMHNIMLDDGMERMKPKYRK